MTGLQDVKKIRLQHLAAAKRAGEKITMLTAYDRPTAAIFDAAGTDLLLVGDSMGNAVLGYANTLPVSLDDCARATRAVAAGAKRALVVSDLPFGSYEASPERCFDSAAVLMKAGAEAVKFEGGARVAPQIALLSGAGIPVMAHLGFTPQSVNTLGGNRVQGRDAASAALLRQDALAVQAAGAFALVLELVPTGLAAEITANLAIPTIGIGAGPGTDGQVLVWTDMAGMSDWAPSFAKRFGEVGAALRSAASAYGQAVRDGAYPDQDHSFPD
ncbi:MAG: 3-methyl-2-oxobutanoate hydroxymethyltransferase [Bifidobacteriaceae bacterium]|jgi:3-methyl-2-oxobutanoate hydroxymethyltransferase|nr:3-methyl-2-oxobutanoate hydroxymethyltransferase [Bifidobacteriaceae bacterium]